MNKIGLALSGGAIVVVTYLTFLLVGYLIGKQMETYPAFRDCIHGPIADNFKTRTKENMQTNKDVVTNGMEHRNNSTNVRAGYDNSSVGHSLGILKNNGTVPEVLNTLRNITETVQYDNLNEHIAQTRDNTKICSNFGVYYFSTMLVSECLIFIVSFLCCMCCVRSHSVFVCCCFPRNNKKDKYHNINLVVISEKEHSTKKPKRKNTLCSQNNNLKEFKRETNSELYDYITKLFHDTWKDNSTFLGADAKGLSHSSTVITEIYHIKNEKLYHAYKCAHQVASSRFNLPTELLNTPVKTCSIQAPIPDETKDDIWIKQGILHEPLIIKDSSSNNVLNGREVFLFHGTQLKNVRDITENGFDVRKSKRGLYGHPGIYLAESSQKADQYTDNPTNRREKNLSMFLVRTSLGNTCIYESHYHRAHLCDTVVGGCGKRFREFVKKDNAQVYPEFLIIYDRL